MRQAGWLRIVAAASRMALSIEALQAMRDTKAQDVAKYAQRILINSSFVAALTPSQTCAWQVECGDLPAAVLARVLPPRGNEGGGGRGHGHGQYVDHEQQGLQQTPQDYSLREVQFQR